MSSSRNTQRSLLVCLAAAALTVACTGIAPRQNEQATRERFLQYAGAPIDQITWFGRFDGWHVLGPDSLVLWTTPFDAYLLTVRGPCIGLEFTQRIGVTSTAGMVSHLDFVTFERQRCPILEIRPVDYQRMRADQKAAAAKPATPQ